MSIKLASVPFPRQSPYGTAATGAIGAHKQSGPIKASGAIPERNYYTGSSCKASGRGINNEAKNAKPTTPAPTNIDKR